MSRISGIDSYKMEILKVNSLLIIICVASCRGAMVSASKRHPHTGDIPQTALVVHYYTVLPHISLQFTTQGAHCKLHIHKALPHNSTISLTTEPCTGNCTRLQTHTLHTHPPHFNNSPHREDVQCTMYISQSLQPHFSTLPIPIYNILCEMNIYCNFDT